MLKHMYGKNNFNTIPFGTYKVRLLKDSEDKSFLNSKKVVGSEYTPAGFEGIYENTKERLILRMTITEGDYEGHIFGLYCSTIDLQYLLGDIAKQLDKNAIETKAGLEAMQNGITLYYVEEIGLDKQSGEEKSYRKWLGHPVAATTSTTKAATNPAVTAALDV